MMETSSSQNREEEKEEMVDNMAGGYNSSNVKKARLNSTLSALLNDPILSDVPKNPSLLDVDTLISLELGSAMRVSVLKMDTSTFEVALMNTAKVKDLKMAIKRKVNDMEQSKMGHRHISWKYVWKNFCLAYHNEKLLNDDASLQDFGIRNNSQYRFISYTTSRQGTSGSIPRERNIASSMALISLLEVVLWP